MADFCCPALLLFAVSLVVTLATVPLATKIAWRVGSVDYPSRRRVNTKPTPRMGGIAVFLGIAVAFVAWAVLAAPLGLPAPSSAVQGGVNIWGVVLSVAVMFAVGIIDDAIQLTALNKFFWQIVAAVVAVLSGVVIGDIASPFGGCLSMGALAYPVTVLVLVSFANIINLIDGVDGLASGVTAICCAALGVISLMTGEAASAALCAAVVGATLGFLRWNFNPAKIFLGDSGSLLLGFSLGIAATLVNTGTTTASMLLAPVVMVGVPILDTFAAIVRRSRVGVSIGTPDKGHIHHRLLKRGLGQRALVGVIYAITALLCVFAFVITQVPYAWKGAIVVALAALALLLGVYLQMFVPVVRRRFDPETGENEVVPIDEVSEDDDYSKEEVASVLLGGVAAGEGESGPSFKTDRPLKVLAVSQHYWPEPFAIADVCEGLAAMGHHVTVLTGTPNYPDGDIYPGYEKGACTSQERNGVHIRRVKIIPRGREVWQRVANYYSFSTAAKREALKVRGDYDVVLSFQTSPVMMARPALAYGRKNNVPVLMWCQDLWPESLTAGNIKRTSLVYKLYARVSRKIYESADVLAVTSTNFSDYFRQVLGMDRETVYLPQYAEDIFAADAEPRPEYDPRQDQPHLRRQRGRRPGGEHPGGGRPLPGGRRPLRHTRRGLRVRAGDPEEVPGRDRRPLRRVPRQAPAGGDALVLRLVRRDGGHLREQCDPGLHAAQEGYQLHGGRQARHRHGDRRGRARHPRGRLRPVLRPRRPDGAGGRVPQVRRHDARGAPPDGRAREALLRGPLRQGQLLHDPGRRASEDGGRKE